MNLIKNLKYLAKSRNIFLFSHMRANTSLLGHIIGTSSEVDGYYEKHLHYFSWKSNLNAKLQYLRDHSPSKNHKYSFDKLLHNHLTVSHSFTKNYNNKFIITIRNPNKTIPSIEKMISRPGFEGVLKTKEDAEQYYLERLNHLEKISANIEGNFIFFDSEEIITNSDSVLERLSTYLGLERKLSPQFEQFPYSSVPKAGDTSGNLNKGIILSSSEFSKNNNYNAPEALMNTYNSLLIKLTKLQVKL